jgi:hypothetical protein
MSRLLASASTQYLQIDSAPSWSYGFTFACWFYLTTKSADQSLMWMGDKDAPDNFFRMQYDSVADEVALTARETGGTEGEAQTTIGGLSTATWYHVAGRYNSTSSRIVYIDAGNSGSNTDTITPVGIDRLTIGRMGDSTPKNELDGRIFVPAIWNIQLAFADIQALANGAWPHEVRGDQLISYYPLFGHTSPEVDWTAGQRHLTLFGGTIARAANPPQFALPTGPMSFLEPEVQVIGPFPTFKPQVS